MLTGVRAPVGNPTGDARNDLPEAESRRGRRLGCRPLQSVASVIRSPGSGRAMATGRDAKRAGVLCHPGAAGIALTRPAPSGPGPLVGCVFNKSCGPAVKVTSKCRYETVHSPSKPCGSLLALPGAPTRDRG